MDTATLEQEVPVKAYGVSDNAIAFRLLKAPSRENGPTATVAWRIKDELADELLARQIKTPQVLLAGISGGKEVVRVVAPLEAGKAHLAFNRSGVVSVIAIVFGADGDSSIQMLSRGLVERNQKGYVNAIYKWVDEEAERLRKICDELRGKVNEIEAILARNFPREIHLDLVEGDTDIAQEINQRLEQIFDLQREIQEIEKRANPLSDADVDLLRAEHKAFRKQYAEASDNLMNQINWSDATMTPVLSLGANSDQLTFGFSHHMNYVQGTRTENLGKFEIEVPKESFSRQCKLPVRWLASRHKHPTPDRDHCQTRARAGSALLTYGPIALFKALLSVPAFIFQCLWLVPLLLAGKRKINFDGLKHPLSTHLENVYCNCEKSVWVWRRNPDKPGEYLPRHRVFSLLNPIVILIVALITLITRSALGFSYRFILGSVALTAVLIMILTSKRVSASLDAWFEKRAVKRQFREKQAIIRVQSDYVDQNLSVFRSIGRPGGRRFAWNFLKAKVCNPYEQTN